MPAFNRYQEALRENVNLLGMATTAAISAALFTPIPLLVGLVAEAAYLLFVPTSRWYENRLERRHDAKIVRRRRDLKRQIAPYLRSEMKERFDRLEQMRCDLEHLPRNEENWYREVLRKMDYLLEQFLMFASREAQFRAYLTSALAEARGEKERPRRSEPRSQEWGSPERRDSLEDQIVGLFFPGLVSLEVPDDEEMLRRRENRRREKQWPPPPQGHSLPRHTADPWVKEVVAEIQARNEMDHQGLREALEHERDYDTQAVLRKRLEVLQRRQEYVEKMGKILINLNHQLELLEDTFGLISDEILAHPPEQVLADIDEVVWQANAMTEALEQIAPVETRSAHRSMNMNLES